MIDFNIKAIHIIEKRRNAGIKSGLARQEKTIGKPPVEPVPKVPKAPKPLQSMTLVSLQSLSYLLNFND